MLPGQGAVELSCSSGLLLAVPALDLAHNGMGWDYRLFHRCLSYLFLSYPPLTQQPSNGFLTVARKLDMN